jgi:archaeal flagellin N-terminal-like domain
LKADFYFFGILERLVFWFFKRGVFYLVHDGARNSCFKRTHRHTRKAISPIIATIILIVITVAVGGLLYAYVSGMFGSMSTSEDVNIQTTLTIPPGSSYATWTVSVRTQELWQ